MTELEMKKFDLAHTALMSFTIVAGGLVGVAFASVLKDNPWKWGALCGAATGLAYPIIACALSPKFKAVMAGEPFPSPNVEQGKDNLTVAVQPQEVKKVEISEPKRIPA